jgi:predicted O-linked N-acetylglucosamine transferase (SPINDLY family)
VQFSLRKEVKQYRIAGARLFFANNLPKPKHLAQKQLADFALDTAHSILALENGSR